MYHAFSSMCTLPEMINWNKTVMYMISADDHQYMSVWRKWSFFLQKPYICYHWDTHTSRPTNPKFRADSRLALSQWETSLQSNAVSHWLGPSLESTLYTHKHTPASCLFFLILWSTTVGLDTIDPDEVHHEFRLNTFCVVLIWALASYNSMIRPGQLYMSFGRHVLNRNNYVLCDIGRCFRCDDVHLVLWQTRWLI